MQRDGHVNLAMVLQAVVIYSHIDLDNTEALGDLRNAWQAEYSDMAEITSAILLESVSLEKFKTTLEQKPVMPQEQ